MSANDEEKMHITKWTEFLQQSKTYFIDNWTKKGNSPVSADDFNGMITLNRSPFGTLIFSRHKTSEKYYAIKVVEKAKLVRKHQVKRALYEKRVLQSIRFPFTTHLEFFFQDDGYLYYVFPYFGDIELFNLIEQSKRLDDSVVKFYAAQVLLALEFLHNLDLVHRDLKPENVVLGKYGYLKLNDFSLCKIVKCRTYTICGTPEYMAPEVILNKGYGKSVDYWAFGVLIYEMATGATPFRGKDKLQLFENILQAAYKNPPFLNREVKDLIKNLFQIDLSRRLGVMMNGVDDIKDHKYFRNIPWLALINKKLVAPRIPTPIRPIKWENEKLYVPSREVHPNLFKDF